MRHIILPRRLPLMLPTFGNNAIELLKGTAVVSLISLTDMTFQAQVVRAQTGNTLIPFGNDPGSLFPACPGPSPPACDGWNAASRAASTA